MVSGIKVMNKAFVCPIVMPGTVRGRLRRDIAEETGLGEVDVIAVGSHDTASAVAAVPLFSSP